LRLFSFYISPENEKRENEADDSGSEGNNRVEESHLILLMINWPCGLLKLHL